MNGRLIAELGILPNLIVAAVLLVLFDMGSHAMHWVAAASIVLLTELIMLGIALELPRRHRRRLG